MLQLSVVIVLLFRPVPEAGLTSTVRMVEVLVTKAGGTVEQEAVMASTRVVLCLDM